MKRLFWILPILTLFVLAACEDSFSEESNTSTDNQPSTEIPDGYIRLSLHTDINRTSYAGGGKIAWSNGDKIVVNNTTCTVNIDGEEAFVYAPSADSYEAFYPAEIRTLTDVMMLQPAQSYSPDSFGAKANPMYGTGDAESGITLRSVCGVAKLNLKGSATISSIAITDKSGGALCGKFDYRDGVATIRPSSVAQSSVVLNCTNVGGVKLTPTGTDFYIVLPAGEYPAGWKLSISDTSGRAMIIDSATPRSVKVNDILSLPAIDYSPDEDLLFAEYFDKIMERIYEIEDGDFKASERTSVSVAAPGYMYSDWTSDEDFETGIKFWSKVTEYMKNRRNFSTGFREQFFYHGKDIPRAEGVKGRMFTSVGVGSFTGADGFYDDKLFAVAACLNYIMKGFDGMTVHNGNAFQEPLAVFDAEYLWNSENSGFYDPPRPKNQEEYVALRDSMIKSLYRPDEIYGDGGFIDVICEKLYGKKIGKSIARVYKISGKNGEPPIPSASSVDIYTNYSKVVYPMRWDTEMSREEIAEKTERFLECNKATRGAKDALKEAFSLGVEDEDARYDLQWLLSCFEVGDRLTYGLYRYMLVYADIDRAFRENKDFSDELKAEIIKVKELGSELLEYVRSLDFKAIDKFGGSSVRREEMADFIEYNAALMLSSIEQNKRIPDGRRPERTRDWW